MLYNIPVFIQPAFDSTIQPLGKFSSLLSITLATICPIIVQGVLHLFGHNVPDINFLLLLSSATNVPGSLIIFGNLCLLDSLIQPWSLESWTINMINLFWSLATFKTFHYSKNLSSSITLKCQFNVLWLLDSHELC